MKAMKLSPPRFKLTLKTGLAQVRDHNRPPQEERSARPQDPTVRTSPTQESFQKTFHSSYEEIQQNAAELLTLQLQVQHFRPRPSEHACNTSQPASTQPPHP
jgi:hypothetical protein